MKKKITKRFEGGGKMTKKQEIMSISKISSMIKKEELRWKAGKTPFSGLRLSEMRKYLGLKVSRSEIKRMAAVVKKEATKEIRKFESAVRFT
ncbi:hypothetical protein KAR91_36805, partial [Candidatus Pacearchaeota archaeon]|nr:hypothetical protein [Candidatus Pacearchaeota archaeon]